MTARDGARRRHPSSSGTPAHPPGGGAGQRSRDIQTALNFTLVVLWLAHTAPLLATALAVWVLLALALGVLWVAAAWLAHRGLW